MNIVIAYLPRSASWTFTDALAGTQVAGRGLECFQVNQVSSYLARNAGRTAADYVSSRLTMTSTPNGNASFRVMWYGWKALHVSLGLKDMTGLHDYFGQPQYILTQRRDLDAQAVSLELARQTGIFQKVKNRPAPQPKQEPVYDKAAILEKKDNLVEQTANWRDYFASVKATPIEVFQEDVASDYKAVVASVLSQLGIDTSALVVPDSKYEKQGNEINADWISRLKT